MTTIHKMIIGVHKVETACKLKIIAYYPQTSRAMITTKNDHKIIDVSFYESSITCRECGGGDF